MTNDIDFSDEWFKGGPGVFRANNGTLWLRDAYGHWSSVGVVIGDVRVGLMMRDNGDIDVNEWGIGYNAKLPGDVAQRYNDAQSAWNASQRELYSFYQRAQQDEWDDDDE